MKLSQSIYVPPSAVFFALTNAAALQEWLVDEARLEPRAGGRFSFWWRERDAVHGTVLEAVPDEKLVLAWPDQAADTAEVSFLLGGVDGGTQVDLVLQGPDDGLAALWREALKNLASVLETGTDLRQARRPFLGIGGGGTLTPEMASLLAVPLSAGFRIQSVVAGSGAAAAGLAADDVLVRLGEQPVTDGATLREALTGIEVGNRLPVTFYRGPIQMTVEITIGPQPQPELPAGPAELAAQVRAIQAETERALEKMVAEAPDAAFEYRPEPEAWSARQLLAHLIVVERWGHHYLTLRVAGQPQGGYANDLGLHEAVTQAYGDVRGLLDEFKRAQNTTAAALANLPDALFAQRRGAVASITSTFTVGLPYHAQTHVAEIRHRLDAARTQAGLTNMADK